jgi:hypothetical protein
MFHFVTISLLFRRSWVAKMTQICLAFHSNRPALESIIASYTPEVDSSKQQGSDNINAGSNPCSNTNTLLLDVSIGFLQVKRRIMLTMT